MPILCLWGRILFTHLFVDQTYSEHLPGTVLAVKDNEDRPGPQAAHSLVEGLVIY